MIFNFNKKKTLEKIDSYVDQSETFSEEEQMKRLDKNFKRMKRKQRLKRYSLIFIVLLGVIGGYKSLLYSEAKDQYEDSENQTFVKTYATNYFNYPKTEDNYLDKYTLSKEWRNTYEKGIEFARLNDVEIYKVKPINQDKGITRYYMYGTLASKKEGANEKNSNISFSIDVAKQNQSYLIVSPVEFIQVAVKAINDEEQLLDYQYEKEEGLDNVSDENLENISNTLNLFIKTYNEDVKQARLLVSNKNALEKLDDGVQLKLLSITKATEDADNYYIEVEMLSLHSEVFSITKNVHFELDKAKNKIKKMEDY